MNGGNCAEGAISIVLKALARLNQHMTRDAVRMVWRRRKHLGQPKFLVVPRQA
jgi:hypothetical protein